MITLWKRTPARARATDEPDDGEKVETSPLVALIPIAVALVAAGGSICVAWINREAGIEFERQRRATALEVEQLREDLLRARPPAPQPAGGTR